MKILIWANTPRGGRGSFRGR